MIVMPSIDLESGRAVKRVRGARGTGLVLGDPVKLAAELAGQGAEWIHVVDLDAAETGKPQHLSVVCRIKRELGVRIQYGGGLRSRESVEEAASAADRLVIGSAWIRSPDFLDEAAEAAGASRILAAVEEKEGRIAYAGWREKSSLTLWEALRVLEKKDVAGYLYTQVDVEGSLEGPDTARVKELRRRTGRILAYAGGISSPRHVRELCEIGVDAVVVGMAIYSGSMSFDEALEAGRCRRSG